MGEQRLFWSRVFVRAWRDFREYLRTSADHLMSELLLVAVSYLVLAFLPGLGHWRDQLNDAVLVAIAVLVAAAIQFLWRLIRAPAMLYAASESRVTTLEHDLRRDANVTAIREELENLYWEGRNFYERQTDKGAWQSGWHRTWMARVEDFVGEHYPANVLFTLRSSLFDPGDHYRLAPIMVGAYDKPPLTPMFVDMRRYLYQIENIIHQDPRGT